MLRLGNVAHVKIVGSCWFRLATHYTIDCQFHDDMVGWDSSERLGSDAEDVRRRESGTVAAFNLRDNGKNC